MLREYCKKKGIKSSSIDELILHTMSNEPCLQGTSLNWYQSIELIPSNRWDFSEINNQHLNDLHQDFLAYSKTKVPNFTDILNKALTVKNVKLEI